MKQAITDLKEFVYGRAMHPVTTARGVVIGEGTVFPELNFTLSAMDVNEQTWPKVRAQYEEMIGSAVQRAVELKVPQLLVEFETLPEMTTHPEWGLDICRLLADRLIAVTEQEGLKTALRFTPNDIREFERPPLMRQGRYWESMQKVFDEAGEAGADLLSIESTGGKELCDEALVQCDLSLVLFSLGVLACRDMDFLWDRIVSACDRNGVIPAGDTACGFANTAMVLADKKMIPCVFAAVVRAASAPRTLVAVTKGAKGPCKDCAYEGVYVKALTGTPISMEGKSAACAHLSPVGNVAAAVCDCWSNESVQNVQLLSGRAPTVSIEQLAYDCRLMNTAARHDGGALTLRDWLAESDAPLDPQAYILKPSIVLEVAARIAEGRTPYEQTRLAATAAIEVLKKGADNGEVDVGDREAVWLDMMQDALADIPNEESAMIEHTLATADLSKCLPSEYGII